jgi:streptogramin lyase
VKTPGIQIDAAVLKPDAAIPVKGLSGPVVAWRNSLFVPQQAEGTFLPIDLKANQPGKPVPVAQPCGGSVAAFGGVWSGSCATPSLIEWDGTGKQKGAIPLESKLESFPLTASADSVWAIADAKTTLLRIDPQRHEIVAETRLPAACPALLSAESAIWAACPDSGQVLRISAKTNLVEKRIEWKGAKGLASGAGSVWAWSSSQGKVARIDPQTNKIAATVDLGLPGMDASLDFGGGFLWISAQGFPLSKVDPEQSKEGGKLVQQFHGEGAGHLRFAGDSVWIADVKSGTLRRFDPKRIAAIIAD